jgi:hypothetical protein
MTSDEIARFVNPVQAYSCEDVLARPSPVPAQDGVYGWWFRKLPPLVVADGCRQRQALGLLYAGISPNRPPGNGRSPSKQTLQKRIKYHYTGNAEGSTLRKTLGCLLADELGIQLRRVGSGTRITFVEGEQVLSAWMAENAYVSWVVRDRPWELEDELIAKLDLPLNLQGNSHNRFHSILTGVRARCVAQAEALSVVPNPGIGGGRRVKPSAALAATVTATAAANGSVNGRQHPRMLARHAAPGDMSGLSGRSWARRPSNRHAGPWSVRDDLANANANNRHGRRPRIGAELIAARNPP